MEVKKLTDNSLEVSERAVNILSRTQIEALKANHQAEVDKFDSWLAELDKK